MRRRAAAIGFAAVVVLLLPAASGAVEPDEILPNAALEARARALSADLRCMVCQNESIDESKAPLARDLRQLVRERLQAGDSDAAIKEGLRARYGDFILLKPPVEGATLLLWGTPLLVLSAGSAGAWLALRRRAGLRAAPLDALEETRVRDLLGQAACERRGETLQNFHPGEMDA